MRHAAARSEITFFLSMEEFAMFTKREWQILGYLSQGMSREDICKQLGISNSTLCGHLKSIRRAFGTKSTDIAVNTAQRMGLVA